MTMWSRHCWHGQLDQNRKDRMNYWLMKSEPSTWSWDDQLAKGEDGEGWDGVRNYQASNNMKAMEIGDLAFFFHSVNEKEAVGIVKIC